MKILHMMQGTCNFFRGDSKMFRKEHFWGGFVRLQDWKPWSTMFCLQDDGRTITFYLLTLVIFWLVKDLSSLHAWDTIQRTIKSVSPSFSSGQFSFWLSQFYLAFFVFSLPSFLLQMEWNLIPRALESRSKVVKTEELFGFGDFNPRAPIHAVVVFALAPGLFFLFLAIAFIITHGISIKRWRGCSFGVCFSQPPLPPYSIFFLLSPHVFIDFSPMLTTSRGADSVAGDFIPLRAGLGFCWILRLFMLVLFLLP